MPSKVRDHESVKHYFDDDDNECTDYPKKISQALDATKLLITAGYHALKKKGLDKRSRLYFEQEFGEHSDKKQKKVRKVFQKLYQLVLDESKVDVNIRIDTKHLTRPTYLYLPHLKAWEECVVDLTRQDAFDAGGRYKRGSHALFHPEMTTFDDPDCKSGAFVPYVEGGRLELQSGKDIFINPDTMKLDDLFAPMGSDRSIKEFEPLTDVNYKKLPGTLFHELCHTTVLGSRRERLLDEEVTPSAVVKDIRQIDRTIFHPSAENPDRDPTLPTFLYGPAFYALVAGSKDKRQAYKCLNNADSYTWFAIAVYLRKLKWDSLNGFMMSVSSTLTDGKTMTQLAMKYGVNEDDSDTDTEEKKAKSG